MSALDDMVNGMVAEHEISSPGTVPESPAYRSAPDEEVASGWKVWLSNRSAA